MTKQEKYDNYSKTFDLCCQTGTITKSSGKFTTFTFTNLDDRKNVNRNIGVFDNGMILGNLYKLTYLLSY